MARGVRVGDLAPDFTLPSQTGAPVRLADRIGRSAVVLYFYARDETLGCTAEACAFRDAFEAFSDAGAEVIGVSSDPVESHRRFAGRLRLPFLLLSDADGAVRERYGVAKWMGLLPGRVTYVIDRAGIVRRVVSSQLDAVRHVREALAALEREAPPPIA